ncbi:hypothetical protein EDD66_110129 [Mobilisporobacter senegalensis]|uniref:Uncharacterized protein n=1 Tax=Mobilisporobacter senegalensis TaxID=1329262 RepID=A0A3N1XL33_9FIRM|nr:hypothetical protein [Mobilisporobacter senegalensis]ROR25772.1 hypothetical protein EDD66_110129 [Mobilisporobacter senegalensis]
MIKPTDFIFNFPIIARSEIATAVNASVYYNYINGKPDGDTPAGIKVEVVLPNFKYEKIIVKLEGIKHPLTPESFEVDGTTYKVKFSPDFQAKFYRTSNGEYSLSCKASTVEIVK